MGSWLAVVIRGCVYALLRPQLDWADWCCRWSIRDAEADSDTQPAEAAASGVLLLGSFPLVGGSSCLCWTILINLISFIQLQSPNLPGLFYF